MEQERSQALITVYRRLVKDDDYDTQTKKVKRSEMVSNVYFHLNPNCVTVQHQFFIAGLIKVPDYCPRRDFAQRRNPEEAP